MECRFPTQQLNMNTQQMRNVTRGRIKPCDADLVLIVHIAKTDSPFPNFLLMVAIGIFKLSSWARCLLTPGLAIFGFISVVWFSLGGFGGT